MNKCFITKLPSSVDNDNLPVLEQLRINWLKQSTLPDNDARAIGLSTNDTVTVKVSGAHFTDNTLNANNGNVKTIRSTDGLVWLYISNDADAVLTIDGKYSLTELNFAKSNKDFLVRSVYFDIEEIKYLTALTGLGLSNTQVSGDISAVSNLTALAYLSLGNTQVSGDISAVTNLTALTALLIDNTQVSGDISAVTNLTALTTLNLYKTQVSGDISAVSNLTALGYLFLNGTQVSGDISAVSNLTALRGLYLSGIQVSGDISAVTNLTALTNLFIDNTQVSGDISAVSNLTALTGLLLDNTQVSGKVDSLSRLIKLTSLANLKGLSLIGDMSKIPANICFIDQSNRKLTTAFTWTAKARQNAKLLAIEGQVPFDTVSMDNMLIDQATCTFSPLNNSPWYKVISVSGVRTSASDAAVTAIQNMGVTITGVVKQA